MADVTIAEALMGLGPAAGGGALLTWVVLNSEGVKTWLKRGKTPSNGSSQKPSTVAVKASEDVGELWEHCQSTTKGVTQRLQKIEDSVHETKTNIAVVGTKVDLVLAQMQKGG